MASLIVSGFVYVDLNARLDSAEDPVNEYEILEIGYQEPTPVPTKTDNTGMYEECESEAEVVMIAEKSEEKASYDDRMETLLNNIGDLPKKEDFVYPSNYIAAMNSYSEHKNQFIGELSDELDEAFDKIETEYQQALTRCAIRYN